VVAVARSEGKEKSGAAIGPAETDAAHFCQQLYPRLVGALSLNCHNREDAEELAQETLSRVVEHWERLRGHEDPEAWAFRTGFNLTSSWWRRRALAQRIDERLRRRGRTTPRRPTRPTRRSTYGRRSRHCPDANARS
jgi:DNA-directed RNA polymerase specialized sigma24 family protein